MNCYIFYYLRKILVFKEQTIGPVLFLFQREPVVMKYHVASNLGKNLREESDEVRR